MLLTRRLPRPSRLTLLVLLSACSLAWGVRALMTQDEEGSPGPGWTSVPPRVPVRLEALRGPLRPLPDVLDLDHFEGVSRAFVPELGVPVALDLRVRLPSGGALEISLSGRRRGGGGGVSVVLDAGRPERSGIREWRDDPDRAGGACPGKPLALNRSGQAIPWRTLRVSVQGNRTDVLVDGTRWASCNTGLDTVGTLTLRSGLLRVQADDLVVTSRGEPVLATGFASPAAGWPWLLLLLVAATLVLVGWTRAEVAWLRRTGMRESDARLASTLTTLPLVLMLFVDTDVSHTMSALRLDLTQPRTLLFGCVAVFVGLLKVLLHLARPGVGRVASRDDGEGRGGPGTEQGRWWRGRPGLIALVAVQTVCALVLADGPHTRTWFVALVGIALPGAWLAFLTFQSSWPQRLILRVESIVSAQMALFALGKVLWEARSSAGLSALVVGRDGAWMPLAMAALALQIVVRLWVLNLNARAVKGADAASLLLAGALVVSGEVAARFSYLDESLAVRESRTVFEELEQVTEGGVHRAWPDRLFPVAFQPRKPETRLRIVCMGSSSTAGAYQMRDLTLFYPFRLQLLLNEDPRLRPTDVINQGVGGWNTLLMRLYLERMVGALDPDLVTFYIGHNDMLTLTSVPYKAYLAQYRGGGGMTSRVQGWLNRSRLYVLFKQLLIATGDNRTAAVPVEDARENLEAVADLGEARGFRVLLMSEGLSPSPEPLRHYFEMLREVAEGRSNVWYLDTAGFLAELPQAEVFLDDCHLTAGGHEILAHRILDYLQAHPELLAGRSGGRDLERAGP